MTERSRRFSKAEVLEIRRRYIAGETQAALGEEHGVTAASIGEIVRGDQYADVGGPVTEYGVQRGALDRWIECAECGRPVAYREASATEHGLLCPVC